MEINQANLPERLLAWAARQMPTERREWGAAMLAELAQLRHPATRWQFALSCTRVALFPPDWRGQNVMVKGMLVTLTAATLIGFMLLRPETSGVWMAYVISFYTIMLFISTILCGNWLVLAAVTWGVVANARGQQPWSKVPPVLQRWGARWGRFGIEVYFGILNPVLYLTLINAAYPVLRRPESEWWFAPLHVLAWALLAAIWGWRIGGAAFNPASRGARIGLRMLLTAALACLLAFLVKDLNLLMQEGAANPLLPNPFVVFPLYLIPAGLLCDYLRTVTKQSDDQPQRFFLLTNRASRFAVTAAVGISLVTFALAAHRRSDANVRKLVSQHAAAIQSAAARYDTDPRLMAAIIYVTHREQLSPLRDTLERLSVSGWAARIDSSNMFNHALDFSLGVAQIKPRTALTASVLATGYTPDTLPEPERGDYRQVEPVGAGWPPPITAQTVAHSPLPVPTDQRTAAQMLLNTETNLETCALILALYQKQWEAANRYWNIRARPDILATLYQIGFARSKPHGNPQSNAFGTRVREVYEQPWLGELLAVQK